MGGNQGSRRKASAPKKKIKILGAVNSAPRIFKIVDHVFLAIMSTEVRRVMR